MLNSLYNKVQSDSNLKGKIHFMALGQGNDENAMKMWKAFHKVPFPLMADPNNSFGKAINFTPYPVTVLMDKSGKILWTHVGTFESADEALQQIKKVVK